jgi:glycosyltransferase involved in cell wall biosynthesis
MRIVLLPGIWPPDVGGPATHGPDLARFLVERGHDVHVVTMGDRRPTKRPCPVTSIPRRYPFPVRYSLVAAAGARAARSADVVYASATYAAAAAVVTATSRPLVAKLVSDPAYERARRYGLFAGTLEDFQRAGTIVVLALKRARTAALRRAFRIVVPSSYLADIARGWGLDTSRLLVIPNAAPPVVEADVVPDGHTFVFAGRLTRQKALDVAIEAVAQVPTAQLLVIGDGPERADLERHAERVGVNGRVSFVGAKSREEVLPLVSTAYAAILSSDWENLPHAAVEALAAGTPVVATAVGGVPEIVRDGVNGLLVPPRAPDELAVALRRLVDSPELREQLSRAARQSVAELHRDRVYGRLEQVLLEAAAR